MNYVILNGVKSTNISGLLIQSLPPVSKPLIRTEIEEIDGRDGDIVTKLGYSAYNKEMSIGLYGDFDIDEVVKYFDSEGTVVFSNEPDKYYNYQIIEQIDFERLIRYRTATVVFHVQPFKYSVIQKTFAKSIQILNVNKFLESQSGITVEAESGHITVSGECTVPVEFYIPVQTVLAIGTYTLTAYANGTGAANTNLRMITTQPTDADSFGGTYLALNDGAIEDVSDTIESVTTYNSVWLYVTAGTADFTIDLALTDDDAKHIEMLNTGNVKSKPQIHLAGIGNVELILNEEKKFLIQFAGYDEVTIDVAQMEAYSGNVLKNRIITGNYNDFQMRIGRNRIGWSGVITEIGLINYSRWI